MLDVLFDTLEFGARSLLVFLTFAACVFVVFVLSRRARMAAEHIEIKLLNERFDYLKEAVRAAVFQPKDYKRYAKAKAKQEKATKKSEAKALVSTARNRVYVLDFEGDLSASGVERLREEVTAVLGFCAEEADDAEATPSEPSESVKEGVSGSHDDAHTNPGDAALVHQNSQPKNEVILRLESPGGTVHGYGLAASQLQRIKASGIPLTVVVDRVAASGGYMMACLANEIISAPFAIVGSIGVAAPVPNVNKLLKKAGVEYNEMTAGEYKRTVSLFGEITDKGREKFQAQLEDTHEMFKTWVSEARPQLAIDEVATGEYWHGLQAVKLGLVDRLSTSDEVLLSRAKDADLFQITFKKPLRFRERLAQSAAGILEQVLIKLIDRVRFVVP